MRQQDKKKRLTFSGDETHCYYKAVRTTHKCKASTGTFSPYPRRAASLRQDKAGFKGKSCSSTPQV
jgi:hypothetical protein